MANKKDLFKQSLTQKKVLRKAAPDVQRSEKIIQNVHTEEESALSPTPASPPPTPKEPVQRVTVDFPVRVYTALKYASFEKRVTLKKFIVDLVRKDLKLEE